MIKKVLSWILFLLAIGVFAFDVYTTVLGTLEVKAQLETVSSGMEYLGVGDDILVLAVGLITLVGWVLSILSIRCAQNRIVRWGSIALSVLIVPVTLLCFFVIYL